MWQGNAADQRLMRHVQVSFRDASGVSLHPLQRTGQVSAASHGSWGSQKAANVWGMFDAPPVPPSIGLSLPQVVPLAGSPRDPRFMVS